jgi:hypothetical protein
LKEGRRKRSIRKRKKVAKQNKKPFVLWVAHDLLHFYYFNASNLYFSLHNFHLLGPSFAKTCEKENLTYLTHSSLVE